jgi:hypothetical protein
LEITKTDYITGFKIWKERTSTLPSGCHLGHYKAIINNTEDKTVVRTANPLTDLVTMTNLPLKYGFAPTRRCKSVTVMIAKDPGSSKIERDHSQLKLIITLLSSSCGGNAWSTMVDNNCFGHQQFACPGHQCINAVHKKTLIYDLAQILAINLAVFDNDATGCYDHIIVALGMIAAL